MATTVKMLIPAEKDGQSRNDEDSGGVPQPPREPNWPVVGPAGETTKCKACHTDRRAYRRAQNGCEKSKLEYISRMIKDLIGVRVLVYQVRANQPLQRIPRGNTQRRPYRPIGGEIG